MIVLKARRSASTAFVAIPVDMNQVIDLMRAGFLGKFSSNSYGRMTDMPTTRPRPSAAAA